ncbi:hypothetical protein M8J76_015821 [Diaphorina citri]|nr:hypothetical protein M8J75_016215 [Diaphorina citri]KAI5716995.1 hypothetical protein M8J76_015821 [Diaphorina citri]
MNRLKSCRTSCRYIPGKRDLKRHHETFSFITRNNLAFQRKNPASKNGNETRYRGTKKLKLNKFVNLKPKFMNFYAKFRRNRLRNACHGDGPRKVTKRVPFRFNNKKTNNTLPPLKLTDPSKYVVVPSRYMQFYEKYKQRKALPVHAMGNHAEIQHPRGQNETDSPQDETNKVAALENSTVKTSPQPLVIKEDRNLEKAHFTLTKSEVQGMLSKWKRANPTTRETIPESSTNLEVPAKRIELPHKDGPSAFSRYLQAIALQKTGSSSKNFSSPEKIAIKSPRDDDEREGANHLTSKPSLKDSAIHKESLEKDNIQVKSSIHMKSLKNEVTKKVKTPVNMPDWYVPPYVRNSVFLMKPLPNNQTLKPFSKHNTGNSANKNDSHGEPRQPKNVDKSENENKLEVGKSKVRKEVKTVKSRDLDFIKLYENDKNRKVEEQRNKAIHKPKTTVGNMKSFLNKSNKLKVELRKKPCGTATNHGPQVKRSYNESFTKWCPVKRPQLARKTHKHLKKKATMKLAMKSPRHDDEREGAIHLTSKSPLKDSAIHKKSLEKDNIQVKSSIHMKSLKNEVKNKVKTPVNMPEWYVPPYVRNNVFLMKSLPNNQTLKPFSKHNTGNSANKNDSRGEPRKPKNVDKSENERKLEVGKSIVRKEVKTAKSRDLDFIKLYENDKNRKVEEQRNKAIHKPKTTVGNMKSFLNKSNKLKVELRKKPCGAASNHEPEVKRSCNETFAKWCQVKRPDLAWRTHKHLMKKKPNKSIRLLQKQMLPNVLQTSLENPFRIQKLRPTVGKKKSAKKLKNKKGKMGKLFKQSKVENKKQPRKNLRPKQNGNGIKNKRQRKRRQSKHQNRSVRKNTTPVKELRFENMEKGQLKKTNLAPIENVKEEVLRLNTAVGEVSIRMV